VGLRRAVALAVAAGLGLPGAVACAEDGFRCPTTSRLVQVGDSARKVEKRCGPPDEREPVVEEYCDSDGDCRRRGGERWTYDFGRTYFVRYLLFFNGLLTRIEEGDYGDK
jgi:hypothetical protein